MTGDSQVINITASFIFEALYVSFVTYLILNRELGDRECCSCYLVGARKEDAAK